jgi:hypothetical protein
MQNWAPSAGNDLVALPRDVRMGADTDKWEAHLQKTSKRIDLQRSYTTSIALHSTRKYLIPTSTEVEDIEWKSSDSDEYVSGIDYSRSIALKEGVFVGVF